MNQLFNINSIISTNEENKLVKESKCKHRLLKKEQ